ncbi:MAG: ATP-dependent RecD-like DNA helicase [Puniceicoccales bacterium]|jgi:exodeoxyribonuclease V alpha subunit|nr:ATP-dependent RecD-like DNA helicase [Puniceicoccales bacterium]
MQFPLLETHTPFQNGSEGSVSLKGVLKRILFSNQDKGYTVGLLYLNEKKETITITGNFPSVQCGETLVVKGFWVEHSQYGKQFQCIQFESQLPSDIHGIRQYLSSGLIHGIGKIYAGKIVDFFGTQTFEVLNGAWVRLMDVPGIGSKRARSIKKAWDEQKIIRDTMIFLQTYGFTNTQCLRLFQHYGADTQAIIKKNPYVIAQTIEGIGFKSADKIALNFGLANDAAFRLDAGIDYIFSEAEGDGNTGCRKECLIRKASALLEVPAGKVEERLRALLSEKILSEYPVAQLLQRPRMAITEAIVAKHVHRLWKAKASLPDIQLDKALQWSEERLGIVWSATQKDALRSILKSKLSILTGGPGTGKTTLLRALVNVLAAKHVRLCLAAPTGRAAQRMIETTGHEAKTVHRTLKYEPSARRFAYDENNWMPVDYLILDEASMLDVSLTHALLCALPDTAHVLLVGDIYQLPSVGPGNVLNDFLQSPYFHVEFLKEIFRQGDKSSIVSTAHAVLAGNRVLESPIHLPDSALNFEEDFHFIGVDTPDSALNVLEKLCWEQLPKYAYVDPIKDIQVLAPMHRGQLGIENINAIFQQKLGMHRPTLKVGGQTFALGDKVIQLKNNYEKNIFNGDLGIIKDVNLEDENLLVQFNDDAQVMERMDCLDLKLAYAISIHKSQGSEFPIVVIPLLTQHFVMLKRNLLYTALTRGRKKVFIVGDPKAYSIAVRTQDSILRQTTLKERLQSQEVSEKYSG